MTDKELFEKTEKHFDLKKSDKINSIFEEGKFNKVLNEIKTSKEPDLPSAGKAAGGFLSRVAAAIPGTRGHRMRSAEARKLEAQAKEAEIDARAAQQRLMKGNSQEKRPYEDWCRKREEEMKKSPLSDKDQRMYNKHCTLTPPKDTGDPKPGQRQRQIQPEVKFKVGDEVFVRTKKNPKAPGIVTKLLDKPGFVQVKVGNVLYAFDKRNVTLKRGINKESFEYIVKKYR